MANLSDCNWTMLQKRSDKLDKTKTQGSFKQGLPNNSLTYKMLKNEGNILGADHYVCQVCNGALHQFYECPTKKKLDQFAKDNNDVANWGQWKYDNYYKAFLASFGGDAEENQKKAKKVIQSVLEKRPASKVLRGDAFKPGRFGAYKRPRTGY